MIWLKLAASLLIALGLVAGATAWRLSAKPLAKPVGQFVTVDGSRIHYLQQGAGPDLVLIHGASGSLLDFQFGMMAELAKTYRVTAFDRPGLGFSEPLPQGNDQLAAQADALRAASAQLGLRDVLLVGQSYGGSVALAWALQDAPRALVLIAAPSLPWPGKLDPWYRVTAHPVGAAIVVPLAAAWVPQSYVRNSISAVFAPNPEPAGYATGISIEQTLRVPVLVANAAQVNNLRPQIVAQHSDYDRLTLPIELIHGDADTIVPLRVHSGPLAERLASADLTVLPGVGHMPHHAALPAVLAAIERAATRAGLR